ncbi:MAG: dihydroneopterin aldolase [Bacteroidales bacterium]|nr:dihydroneopterin aldolase [Bacteroidales bacterium]
MGTISLDNMEFYAYHGCFDAERVIGTHFRVNLSFDADITNASESDHLSETINYQDVYLMVKEEMAQKSHLLEHIARRILVKLHGRYPQVEFADVKISKMNPPLGGKMESVSVSLNSAEIEL